MARNKQHRGNNNNRRQRSNSLPGNSGRSSVPLSKISPKEAAKRAQKRKQRRKTLEAQHLNRQQQTESGSQKTSGIRSRQPAAIPTGARSSNDQPGTAAGAIPNSESPFESRARAEQQVDISSISEISSEENSGVEKSSEENSGEENSGEENSGEENSSEENSSEESSGEESSGEESSSEENSGEENSDEQDAGDDDPIAKIERGIPLVAADLKNKWKGVKNKQDLKDLKSDIANQMKALDLEVYNRNFEKYLNYCFDKGITPDFEFEDGKVYGVPRDWNGGTTIKNNAEPPLFGPKEIDEQWKK